MIAPILIAALILGFDVVGADMFCLAKYWILAAGLSIGALVSPFPRTKLDSPAALFIGVLTFICAYSPDPLVSIVGQWGFYFQALLPSLLILFSLHLGASHPPSVLLKALVWSCLIATLIGIGQRFGLFLGFPMAAGNRIYSTIGGPVFLAAHLGLGIIASLLLGWILPIPIIAIGLILTGSRAGILMVGVGVLILTFRLSNRIPRGFMALLMGFICLFCFLGLKGRDIKQSDIGRTHMIRLGLAAHLERPWLGIGPDRFNKVMETRRDSWLDQDMGPVWSNGYVHNSFLDALITGGRVLFAAYLVLLAAIAYCLYESNDVIGLSMGTALLAFSLFQPTPLTAKAICAMVIGSGQKAAGTLDRGEQLAAQIILLGILLAVSVLVAGSHLYTIASRLDGNATAFQYGVRFAPMIYR